MLTLKNFTDIKMYLPLPTKIAADTRNKFEAFKRGCIYPTVYWWEAPIMYNGSWYLDVGDGSVGTPYVLIEEELKACVDKIKIPNE